MKHNLESAMELVGANSEQEFKNEFANKSVEEINETLIQMFGQEGDDIEFAEVIKILASN